MPIIIIRLPEVIAQTGLSRSTIYHLIANKGFPKGVPIGTHARGWLQHEVEEWIESRAALRGNRDDS